MCCKEFPSNEQWALLKTASGLQAMSEPLSENKTVRGQEYEKYSAPASFKK